MHCPVPDKPPGSHSDLRHVASCGLAVASRQFARSDESSSDLVEFQVMLLAVSTKEFEGSVSIEPEPLHQYPLRLTDLFSSIDPLSDRMLLPCSRQRHRGVSSQNLGHRDVVAVESERFSAVEG